MAPALLILFPETEGDFTMKTITDFMEQDHDRLDGLFKDFQSAKAGDPAKAKALFSEFKRSLQRHIIWEEEILFPRFERRTLSAGGRSRRAEDFEAIALGDGGEPRHVRRRTGVRRRQHAGGGWLPDFPHEAFELHGRESD